MKIWPVVVALLLASIALPDLASAACRRCRKCREHAYVVRHFHAGPDAPVQYDDDPNCGFVYVEDVDARRCGDGQRQGYWRRVNTNGCGYRYCCYDRNCPLYDDNVVDGSVCDPTYDYPGKHTEGWMFEAAQ